MIKKLSVFLIILCVLFSFSVSAAGKISLKVDDEFTVYEKNPETVAKILNLNAKELEKEIKESSTIYLAVNKSNTKQIKVNCYKTDFSSSVVNLNGLSATEIDSVMEDIMGEGAKGEIFDFHGQKFIKRVLSSSEEGKECTVTQYITIANKEYFLLSFYTSKGENEEYISEVFTSFESPFFAQEKQHALIYKDILPIAAVIFLAVGIFVGITIIKDLRKKA